MFVRGQVYVMNATVRKKLPAPYVGVIWIVSLVMVQADIFVKIVKGAVCVQTVMTVG